MLYLFFNLLQFIALLTDVVEQLQSFIIFLGDLHTSLLQTALQTLHTKHLNVHYLKTILN